MFVKLKIWYLTKLEQINETIRYTAKNRKMLIFMIGFVIVLITAILEEIF